MVGGLEWPVSIKDCIPAFIVADAGIKGAWDWASEHCWEDRTGTGSTWTVPLVSWNIASNVVI